MEIKIQPITKENFKNYGQLIESVISEDATITTDSIAFWKQQIIAGFNGDIEIGVLKAKKAEMIFSDLENHFITPTGLISLDGSFTIAVGTPSDEIPKEGAIEAFEVAPLQMITLDAKCWHSGCYPLDKEEITVLVFLNKDALDKDTVFEKAATTYNLKKA